MQLKALAYVLACGVSIGAVWYASLVIGVSR